VAVVKLQGGRDPQTATFAARLQDERRRTVVVLASYRFLLRSAVTWRKASV
jgi:hypothetical protein